MKKTSPIPFKKLKKLVNDVNGQISDDLPVVLMDRNETMHTIKEMVLYYSESEAPTFAALMFEPLTVINKKMVHSNELDEYEDVLQQATSLSKMKSRAAMSFLNERGFFMIKLNELGQLRKEAAEYSVIKAQNIELQEYVEEQDKRITEMEKHIDELLDLIPRN